MLPFTAVSHISVTVTNLEEARGFYGGLLGLGEIPRPDFRFPGAWYALDGGPAYRRTIAEPRERSSSSTK